MQNWIKTNGEEGVTQLGDRYLVHIASDEDGVMYECVANTNDLTVLAADLESWKTSKALRLASLNRKQRMKEILAELQATDYLALKAYEGEDMSEHPDWKENRASLRAEYRQLEAHENV